MKTKFKTSFENEQETKIQELLKNNNFRNNQNYIMWDYRYRKAYRYFSNYWLFTKYLHIEKVVNIKDYNQWLYGLIWVMIFFSYGMVWSFSWFIKYNIFLIIIWIIIYFINRYIENKNRREIKIYSNLREIIFINNSFKKYRELEKKAEEQDNYSFWSDLY